MEQEWLTVRRGEAPLVLAFPHSGTAIPPEIEARLVSPALGRKDADWWVDRLYAFAEELDATMVATALSRTVIDVNRDPSGVSLYPGQATTGLCPVTTFDGEPLYLSGEEPDEAEIAQRKSRWFKPYHDALEAELDRLARQHGSVVLYDCHSIRSHIPRLFDGLLPNFNIGTDGGRTCDSALQTAVEAACDASNFSRVTNGRFRGGYTTRHYGRPERGWHAIQMELACRGYMQEPGIDGLSPVLDDWPTPYDPAFAAPMRTVLRSVLKACLAYNYGANT